MGVFTRVKYGKGEACFLIRKENPGIYLARLTYYNGDRTDNPPDEITLIRGSRHWTGSFADNTLLNELGKSIEDLFSKLSPKEF
jgi:hypothetical protein